MCNNSLSTGTSSQWRWCPVVGHHSNGLHTVTHHEINFSIIEVAEQLLSAQLWPAPNNCFIFLFVSSESLKWRIEIVLFMSSAATRIMGLKELWLLFLYCCRVQYRVNSVLHCLLSNSNCFISGSRDRNARWQCNAMPAEYGNCSRNVTH